MDKTFVEDERPCDSCVNVTRYGCVSWNCEYINRDEAIKAWREKHEMADRKTENCSEIPNNSTISKMEQVDEPQTDCGDFADRLAYERGVKHAWEVAQKVFNSTVTFYEAENVAKQIDKDINVRSKGEPQTERSE